MLVTYFRRDFDSQSFNINSIILLWNFIIIFLFGIYVRDKNHAISWIKKILWCPYINNGEENWFFLFHWSIDWLESSIIKVLYINQYRVCQLFFCFRKPSFSFDCFLDSLRQVVCAYCVSNVKYEWHPMSLDLLNILQSITDKQCLGSNIKSNFKFLFVARRCCCVPLHILVMVHVIIGSHYEWNEFFKYRLYAFKPKNHACVFIQISKDIGNENWCLLDS